MKVFTLITLLLFSQLGLASDLAKEKRWADQTVDSIMDGEATWLKAGEHEFLGIYTEASDPSEKAVIIMHGTGIHPNWSQVILPLRVGLAQHGWNTLSIQMPILHNEAEYPEYAPLYEEVPPRIDAAIKFLKENGIKSIYLVGHSQGSVMGAYYLSRGANSIKGFVAVGMPVFTNDPRMNATVTLKKIKLPVFDLYGTSDLPSVKDSAADRLAAAKLAANSDYQQQQITGDHFFEGQEEQLTETVLEWLNKH